MEYEKHEMTVRELGDYILMAICLVALIGFAIAPFLWLIGII